MRALTVFVLFTFLVAAAGAGEIPDTPAGRQLAALNEVFGSEDPAVHSRFVETRFAPEFLARFPAREHAGFLGQVAGTHGGFRWHHVWAESEVALVAVGESRRMEGAWRRLELSVEADPPHRITELGLDRTSPPDAPDVSALPEPRAIAAIVRDLDAMAGKDSFSGAVLVARGDDVLLREARGHASRRFDVPNTPTTRFNVGSINKWFTSVAIAQLLEDGRLHLDDTVGRFLPQFPPSIGDRVTVRHLLTMRSGMGDYFQLPEYRARMFEIRSVGELVDIIALQPLEFDPGTGRRYSNSGFTVLGGIIEAVTGQDYYEYIREHVYEAAGMTASGSFMMDQPVKNVAIGYTRNRLDPDLPRQNNLFLHSLRGGPAGGGYSTVDDLFAFLQVLRGHRLLSERWSNAVMRLFDGPEEEWWTRPDFIGVGGGAPVGINATVESNLETGHTVIVLANYDPPVAEETASRFMRLLGSWPE